MTSADVQLGPLGAGSRQVLPRRSLDFGGGSGGRELACSLKGKFQVPEDLVHQLVRRHRPLLRGLPQTRHDLAGKIIQKLA